MLERVVFVVFFGSLAMVMVNAGGLQDNLTTLTEFFHQRYQEHLHDQPLQELTDEYSGLHLYTLDDDISSSSPNETSRLVTFSNLLLEYTRTLVQIGIVRLSASVGDVSVESVVDDLNSHCPQELQPRLTSLLYAITGNTSCVRSRLRQLVALRASDTLEEALGNLSRDCLGLCLTVDPGCTRTFETHVGQLLRSFVRQFNEIEPDSESVPAWTLINQVYDNMYAYGYLLFAFRHLHSYLRDSDWETFPLQNLLLRFTDKRILEWQLRDDKPGMSHDQFTWRIISSHNATGNPLCSYHKDKYSRDNLMHCTREKLVQSMSDLTRCAFQDLSPLTWWSTSSALFFHSQCLCVAAHGDSCGLESLDADSYCLSVLLRDLQRRVTSRSAVTYLDHAFQTPLPVCVFSNFLYSSFQSICEPSEDVNQAVPTRCYFQNLVNKDLDCPEAAVVDTYNLTVLCGMKDFIAFVVCDDEEADDELHVPLYTFLHSRMVQVLTGVDVAVRLVTLVTFLAYQKLRDIPGTMLMCYLTTTLLRLLVVPAIILRDLTLAVRLDVAADLSSTLWLTASLHSLTSTLRRPQPLTPAKARLLFLRYALFGWALPVALSAAFITLDQLLDSRVQVGQLLFVLSNYAALSTNLYMLYRNFFEITNSTREFFSLALMTSVLTAAGISFRLVLTLHQGWGQLINFYHFGGVIQGVIILLLSGWWNLEARRFFRSRQRRDSFQLTQISHQNTSMAP